MYIFIHENIINFLLYLGTALSATMKCPSRSAVTRGLVERYDAMVTSLKTNLASIEHLSTTADIWSTKHRSFLGMTIHWVSCIYS